MARHHLIGWQGRSHPDPDYRRWPAAAGVHPGRARGTLWAADARRGMMRIYHAAGNHNSTIWTVICLRVIGSLLLLRLPRFEKAGVEIPAH